MNAKQYIKDVSIGRDAGLFWPVLIIDVAAVGIMLYVLSHFRR